jgi:hypothetical protein
MINPIGLLDCVDKNASKIRYHMDGGKKSVLAIDKLVLSKSLLQNAPPLFKIAEDPSECFINLHLARALQKTEMENIIVKEIETL